MGQSPPKPLTQGQTRSAIGLGPDWRMIWVRQDPFAAREHLCVGRLGPGGASRSEWVRVRYAPTGMPGVQAAKCDQCRIAWVRALRGRAPPASAAGRVDSRRG